MNARGAMEVILGSLALRAASGEPMFVSLGRRGARYVFNFRSPHSSADEIQNRLWTRTG